MRIDVDEYGDQKSESLGLFQKADDLGKVTSPDCFCNVNNLSGFANSSNMAWLSIVIEELLQEASASASTAYIERIRLAAEGLKMSLLSR